MSDIQAANRFLVQFDNLIKATREWEGVQSIERAIAEAQGRLRALREAEVNLTESLAAAADEQIRNIEESFAGERAKVDASVLDGRVLAQQIVDDARETAAKGLADAKVEAQRIVQDAEDAAQKCEASIERLQKTISSLEEQIRQRQDDLHAVNLLTHEAGVKHAEATRKLSDLRAVLKD